ncbi:hypothetical protein PTSG_01791 [Salpingoeca rosetta]|uniref:EamA domain-containing protein n=1 Tax=Salpingoeca rosetta (strain ATCC 50818 / BSB-021) TaxID=946362 RepID=F2TYZ2_SALR5|nr:uncharacterized protein PTSG_01791 [Salpingoeca rosetta]EGD78816.1 hypothetical protein PTSG_01791 [Salpingoeca rosetta]|eukprot:XP_004997772.1 hypothetical protein PTSG_01791 [Salpingoeca rosetta]
MAAGAGGGAGVSLQRGGPPLAVVLLLLVLVQFAFGGYGIVLQAFAKDAHADSLVFSMLRDAFCAPVLLLAAIVFERTFVLPRLREIPLLFALGLLGMFGNQYFYIQGLYFSTPNIASIFQPCIPVFTALFAFLVCMEPLPSKSRAYQWLKVLGILLGAGGAIVMTLGRPESAPSQVRVQHFSDFSCHVLNSTDTYKTTTCFNSSSPDSPFIINAPYFEFACVKGTGGGNTTGNASTASCFEVEVKTFSDKACTTLNRTWVPHSQSTCHAGMTLACVHPSAESQVLGIVFLLLNCSCMAVYVLLQKRFVFGRSEQDKRDPLSIARWHKYPPEVRLLPALKPNQPIHRQNPPTQAMGRFDGLKWPWALVTSFWPVQVFVTVVLSYFVFGDELATLEYVGMALIMLGMLAVSLGNYRETRPPKSSRANSAEVDQLLINHDY